MTDAPHELSPLANTLAERLKTAKAQLVFAESCTAGLASSTLAGVPGISEHLCGSAVVYQIPTKEAWLQIPPDLIRHEGVVSATVALAMARNVLKITPQATVSAAITGDLGPDAPPATDGTAWIACATRDERTLTKHVELPSEVPEDGTSLRFVRQRAAAELLLQTVIDFLPTE
jgi:PncC family amidohydrolase